MQRARSYSKPSKLIDMHLDRALDSDTYHSKLEEYKRQKCEIISKMKVHANTHRRCLITARIELDLAKRAKNLFRRWKMNKNNNC
ncbi:hypothetical protein NEOC84_000969|nr:hypothetical protein [Neochlamydia sp. AcF95]NGY95060.1 hypothetical protein [Neochlamydia sp. AcF84]